MTSRIICLAGMLSFGALAASRGEPDFVRDKPIVDGLAAIVDDEVVTYSEVETQAAPTISRLRQSLTGTELNAQIKQAKLTALKALMIRLLIVHEFKRRGGSIPDIELQKVLEERISTLYAGDAGAFEKSLAQHGETLDEFKKELSDNLVVRYMRAKYVTERVKAMNPANAYEADKFAKAVEDSWIKTLYGKSYSRNFLGVPTGG